MQVFAINEDYADHDATTIDARLAHPSDKQSSKLFA